MLNVCVNAKVSIYNTCDKGIQMSQCTLWVTQLLVTYT